jgi:hypothetical protein
MRDHQQNNSDDRDPTCLRSRDKQDAAYILINSVLKSYSDHNSSAPGFDTRTESKLVPNLQDSLCPINEIIRSRLSRISDMVELNLSNCKIEQVQGLEELNNIQRYGSQ